MTIRLLAGDARDMLATLPDASVHCVVTSPPYWGLRDYQTASWDGGDAGCSHVHRATRGDAGRPTTLVARGVGGALIPSGSSQPVDTPMQYRDTCGKCGATRVDRQIGLEATAEAYLETMVAVFREVRRVLRPDGTLWLNIGSSFASKRVESDRHIIRRDLPDATRSKIAQAMSAVWSGYASPEQALQGLSYQGNRKTGELSTATVREVSNHVHGPLVPCREGTRQVLFSRMQGISDAEPQADNSSHAVHSLRQAGETNSSRDAEEKDRDPLLFGSLLVSAQSEGAALSVGRGATSEDEPGQQTVAARGDEARPQAVSNMLHEREVGGASHSSVSQSPGGPMASGQWGNSLPEMPPLAGSRRDGMGGNPDGASQDTAELLGRITFTRASIPRGFERWCEPESIIKPKDDLAMPEMLAIALRDDGWFLRSRIIWHKPNPMPESVTDRPTSAHEHVFLLTRSSRYFYDADAVREIDGGTDHRRNVVEPVNRSNGYLSDDSGIRTAEGRNGTGRNLRNVWTIATHPFQSAHFATFPPALVERCVRAGTSERGCCAQCGAPWRRETDVTYRNPGNRTTNGPRSIENRGVVSAGYAVRLERDTTTTGWSPSCEHRTVPVPCTVLDPFFGAGTTGLVADRLGRDAIGIDLNPDYNAMSRARITDDAPLFAAFPIVDPAEERQADMWQEPVAK